MPDYQQAFSIGHSQQPLGTAVPGLDDSFAHLRTAFERFGPLSDAVWADVRRHWRLRSVHRRDVLTHEGETERTFSLVIEGSQRAYFLTPGGEEITVAFTYPYHHSGIPDSFFLQKPSAYTLEALTDGAFLAIDYENLKTLMDQHRELERWAWRLLAAALAGRGKRERELLTLTAEERYQRLFREAPHLLQLVALKHLASYLGMTPETLSRIRAGRS